MTADKIAQNAPAESEHVSTVKIYIVVREDQKIEDALEGLPGYCTKTFTEHSKGYWNGEFRISCAVAPLLADGDFIDDFAPHFRQLLNLKTFYEANFVFQIAVGSPAPEYFELPSHMVALLAGLGAEIQVISNPLPKTIKVPRAP